MSLQNVLDVLAERGLSVHVDEGGTPHLCGRSEEVTPALREALAAYRDEIVRRFRPKATRRVVLLSGGRDSEVEEVLEECPPEGHHGRVREWGQKHPGRTVAAEWLKTTGGREVWVRFLWLTWPAEGQEATA
jgi:hypothetical protein